MRRGIGDAGGKRLHRANIWIRCFQIKKKYFPLWKKQFSCSESRELPARDSQIQSHGWDLKMSRISFWQMTCCPEKMIILLLRSTLREALPAKRKDWAGGEESYINKPGTGKWSAAAGC